MNEEWPDVMGGKNLIETGKRLKHMEYLRSTPEYNPDSTRLCQRCNHAAPHRYETWDSTWVDDYAGDGDIGHSTKVERSECRACVTEGNWPVCRESDRFLADMQILIRALQDELDFRDLSNG